MKVVNVTAVRQDATAIIRHARETAEPVLVVQRSRPAAYLVDAAQFDAMRDELRVLRRQELLRDVAAAEAEIDRGEAQSFESVDALVASWDETPRQRKAPRRHG
jgi:prevent-host-death family protein